MHEPKILHVCTCHQKHAPIKSSLYLTNPSKYALIIILPSSNTWNYNWSSFHHYKFPRGLLLCSPFLILITKHQQIHTHSLQTIPTNQNMCMLLWIYFSCHDLNHMISFCNPTHCLHIHVTQHVFKQIKLGALGESARICFLPDWQFID